MANVYKQPSSASEYISDSRRGNTAPKNVSHGMRHDPCGHEGETILATGAVNNVGRSCLNIENSLLDETFGGGIDNDDLRVVFGDKGATHVVEDEHGDRGVKRTTQSQRQAEAEQAISGSFGPFGTHSRGEII
jgi:hypothetical protein